MGVREAARPATRGDAARIAALHDAATEELRGERGGALWARRGDRAGVASRLRAAADGRSDEPVSSDDHLVLAGTLDDAVVGYAVCAVEPLDDGSLLAVLHDVYVEPEAREVGVGEALLATAVSWASARGCTGIDAIALPGMRASKNFFEAAGLTARLLVVHRPLP